MTPSVLVGARFHMAKKPMNDTMQKEIERAIIREFPQIAMHGGRADIVDLDEESGYAHIVLGASCHGCGISGMTMLALKNRLCEYVDGLNDVRVETTESYGATNDGGFGDVPF
jgi:Fe-S cluster biogenesis protein NfuA